jgi:hypothetical protein
MIDGTAYFLMVLTFFAAAAWMHFHPGQMHTLWLVLLLVIFADAAIRTLSYFWGLI